MIRELAAFAANLALLAEQTQAEMRICSNVCGNPQADVNPHGSGKAEPGNAGGAKEGRRGAQRGRTRAARRGSCAPDVLETAPGCC